MPKQKLRGEMRAKLAAHPAPERAEKSRKIGEKLFAMPVFRRARFVGFYASMGEEVETHPMIDRAILEGKRVALPRVDRQAREIRFFEIGNRARDTRPGTLGIPEPVEGLAAVDPSKFECVIVPGLAFDAAGRRLGRGAGFYDRYLERLSPGAAKIGLAFSFQIVKAVPHEAHDEKMDLVLTDG